MEAAALDRLLARARNRDPDALEVLVKHYSARVFGLLYRLSGSRDVAEDLLQETFLRVVRTIGGYEHTGRFEPWLFRIAANLARDRARRGRRRGIEVSLDRSAADAEATTPEVADAAQSDPAESLTRVEARERLDRCLAGMTEMDREIILLRHFSELSFREIAELLGVPVGTALARAHRALNRMRNELGGPD